MSLPRCPKKRCREILIERPGPFGQLTWVCVPCEVNEAGFCRRCPNELPPRKDGTNKGRPKYCPGCGVAVAREQEQLRGARRHEEQRDYQRRRRDDPVIYARMLAANAKRRKPAKRDDLDRHLHNEYEKRRRRGAPRVTVDRRPKVAA